MLMRGKLIFIAGAALGFVLGSKQGRQAYDGIKTKAADTWSNPKVRDGVSKAADLARDKVPGGEKFVAIAEKAAGKVDERAGTLAADTEAPAGESAGDDTAKSQSSTPTPATVANASSSADSSNRD